MWKLTHFIPAGLLLITSLPSTYLTQSGSASLQPEVPFQPVGDPTKTSHTPAEAHQQLLPARPSNRGTSSRFSFSYAPQVEGYWRVSAKALGLAVSPLDLLGSYTLSLANRLYCRFSPINLEAVAGNSSNVTGHCFFGDQYRFASGIAAFQSGCDWHYGAKALRGALGASVRLKPFLLGLNGYHSLWSSATSEQQAANGVSVHGFLPKLFFAPLYLKAEYRYFASAIQVSTSRYKALHAAVIRPGWRIGKGIKLKGLLEIGNRDKASGVGIVALGGSLRFHYKQPSSNRLLHELLPVCFLMPLTAKVGSAKGSVEESVFYRAAKSFKLGEKVDMAYFPSCGLSGAAESTLILEVNGNGKLVSLDTKKWALRKLSESRGDTTYYRCEWKGGVQNNAPFRYKLVDNATKKETEGTWPPGKSDKLFAKFYRISNAAVTYPSASLQGPISAEEAKMVFESYKPLIGCMTSVTYADRDPVVWVKSEPEGSTKKVFSLETGAITKGEDLVGGTHGFISLET